MHHKHGSGSGLGKSGGDSRSPRGSAPATLPGVRHPGRRSQPTPSTAKRRDRRAAGSSTAGSSSAGEVPPHADTGTRRDSMNCGYERAQFGQQPRFAQPDKSIATTTNRPPDHVTPPIDFPMGGNLGQSRSCVPLLRKKWHSRALQVSSSNTMATKSQIVAELKKALRASGHTYADVAKALDLSVASVKRLFSTEDLSLHRVDQICDLIGARSAGDSRIGPWIGPSRSISSPPPRKASSSPIRSSSS